MALSKTDMSHHVMARVKAANAHLAQARGIQPPTLSTHTSVMDHMRAFARRVGSTFKP